MFLDKLAKDYEGRDTVDIIINEAHGYDDALNSVEVGSVLYAEGYDMQSIEAGDVDARTVAQVLEDWAERKIRRKCGRDLFIEDIHIYAHYEVSDERIAEYIEDYALEIAEHLKPVLFASTELMSDYAIYDVICDRLDELKKRGK